MEYDRILPQFDSKPRARRAVCLLVGAGLLLAADAGCDSSVQDNRPVLRIGTTTTIRDSGLLDVLLPAFEEQSGVRVDVIASGTGKTLALGRGGEVDLIWVHEPDSEAKFMQQGHGIRHKVVMWNSFVLLGPADDPVEVRGSPAAAALQQIARRRARFCSRGDRSGTHQRELQLWELGGGRPEWDDCLESGQGAGPTIWMADQLLAYTLSDYGTFLKFRPRISLEIFCQGEPALVNRYSAILIDPEKHPAIKADLAHQLLEFLIDPTTQEKIESYTISGHPLFHPAATLPEILLQP